MQREDKEETLCNGEGSLDPYEAWAGGLLEKASSSSPFCQVAKVMITENNFLER